MGYTTRDTPGDTPGTGPTPSHGVLAYLLGHTADSIAT